MNKTQAEQILEITPPYTYAELRKAWRQRCLEYHPDRCAATGMDDKMAGEALREINEAYEYLKNLAGQDGNQGSHSDAGRRSSTSSPEDAAATYLMAKMLMAVAETMQDWTKAEVAFRAISGYADADYLAERCAFYAKEADRKAEEARRAEERRKAEEARRAEEARKAEERRKAEEAKRAEERRKAEQRRKAEEARKAEERRKAEEKRRAEEKRKAEEAHRRALVARSLQTSENDLRKFAKDGAEEVREAVAANVGAPADALELLARDPRSTVRAAVAGNRNTPEGLLSELAKDKVVSVRAAVAGNESTPEQVIIEYKNMTPGKLFPEWKYMGLFLDEHATVRVAVAKRAGLPAEAVKSLLRAKEASVRVAVAENPGVGAWALEILARDDDYSVRKTVAGNPSTPDSTLAELAKDNNTAVRNTAVTSHSARKSKDAAPVDAAQSDADAVIEIVGTGGQGNGGGARTRKPSNSSKKAGQTRDDPKTGKTAFRAVILALVVFVVMIVVITAIKPTSHSYSYNSATTSNSAVATQLSGKISARHPAIPSTATTVGIPYEWVYSDETDDDSSSRYLEIRPSSSQLLCSIDIDVHSLEATFGEQFEQIRDTYSARDLEEEAALSLNGTYGLDTVDSHTAELTIINEIDYWVVRTKGAYSNRPATMTLYSCIVDGILYRYTLYSLEDEEQVNIALDDVLKAIVSSAKYM